MKEIAYLFHDYPFCYVVLIVNKYMFDLKTQRAFCKKCALCIKKHGPSIFFYSLDPETRNDTYKICVYSMNAIYEDFTCEDDSNEKEPDEIFEFQNNAELARGLKLFKAVLELEMLEAPLDGMYN